MSEIVIHRTDGEGLPVRARRAVAETIDVRVTRLLALALPVDVGPVSEIGFAAQLGAMAAASKAALALDLVCYLRWCEDTRIAPLPAEPENLVRYITMLETRGAKPATVARRVASLATAHGTRHTACQACGKGACAHQPRHGARRAQGAPPASWRRAASGRALALRCYARSAYQRINPDGAARRLWWRSAGPARCSTAVARL